jgi:1-phosphatidylinositol-4-phosphate 5-kinase
MDYSFLEYKYNNSTTFVGYAENTGLLLVLLFGSLSLITNLIFMINYIMKLSSNQKNKLSSLEKLMLILSIFESLISTCWIFSAKKFPTNYDIIDNVRNKNITERITNSTCTNIAFATNFCYNFDWLLLCFVIIHVKNIILNPVDSVLKSDKKIKLYILICTIFALFVAIICYILDIYGRSPMITCNIQLTYLTDRYGERSFKEYAIVSFMIVPLIPLFTGIYEVINILKSDEFKNDYEIKAFFKNYLIYIGTYIFSSLLYVIMYIIDYVIKIKYSKTLKWIFCISTMIICITPFIVGIIRLIQTKSYKRLEIICSEKKKKKKYNSNEIELSRDTQSTFLQFNDFEKSSVANFVSNIYITICSIYSMNKNNQIYSKNDINHKNCIAAEKHIIRNSNILNEDLINDLELIKKEKFEISCVEFAPKVFSYLRNEDKITNSNLINSFLPSLNSNEIIQGSEAKGGNFFLNSYDRKYILKTLNYQELELIRNLLLEKLALHLSINKQSLIARIYGMYKIQTKSGLFKENEVYFILMKNVFGVFENNYILKFDMKGSELNREVNTDKIYNLKKCVLKDTNFIKMEHALLLSKENLKKLRNITQKDSSFLLDCKVMDYSLLVIKLEMNNDEMISLFSNEHMKNTLENINMYNDDSKDKIIKVNKQIKFNENNIKFPYADIENVKKYIFPSLDIKYFYIICIIDYFQLYDFQKYLETQIKRVKTEREKISSVPPKEYKERFDFFIQKITSPENIKEQLEKLNII